MNKDLLEKIIEYGTQAPSGDNSQPWIFTITNNNEILLENVPNRDNPVLNVHQGGSLISHGAVILNIRIASEYFGYRAIISYFPDNNNNEIIAKISFEKNNPNTPILYSNLFDSIKKRCTNRNYYKKDLPQNIKNEIEKSIKSTEFKVNLFYNQSDKDIISSCISLSEEVILSTKDLHELLFADIAWTKKEESIKKHGLFVKTLEFNPVQLFVFWLCRKWKNISFLNDKIGFSNIVGKQNADIYKTSGLLGLIVIPNTEKITYVKAGELFQSIWIKSTELGLGFQPITGLFFLNERIKMFGDDPLSADNSKKITDAYNKLKKILNTNEQETILTAFRMGQSKETSGRSSRLKPNIIIK